MYFRNIRFSAKLDSEADYQNMVKSGLISGGHVRPGPDMKIWLDFGQGRGRIWYPVQH